jgi:(2R)-3-sulfolactate dehydrogenase (NADP+)
VVYCLESYCTQLASGRVNGTVDPVVSRARPGAVMSDACFGFAQPAFAATMPMAIDATRENGAATLAVAHAHTCTSLGYFTEQIAAEGLIGMGFTNASPVVAPPGGKTAVIGTNPIAMTVPGDGAPAWHFYFSTSAVALGKITMAKAAGKPIPPGWAVDADGHNIPGGRPEGGVGQRR